jgi:hypothetical protein
MRIRDPVFGMEKIRIRDGKNSDPGSKIKHPGSATLLFPEISLCRPMVKLMTPMTVMPKKDKTVSTGISVK